MKEEKKLKNKIIENNRDWKDKTIPVFVDSIKDDSDFQMTRLTFLVIDYEEDQINWHKVLEEKNIPFITIGPFSVLYKPIGKKEKFDSVNTIENTLDIIEKELFIIEYNAVWMPNFIFNKLPARGQVYRIKLPLFRKSYQFTQDRLSEDLFFEFCNEHKADIFFDELETKSFIGWENKRIKVTIDKHKELYDKSEDEYFKQYLKFKKEGRG